MKIHEYQAKAILKKFGVAVPDGRVAHTVEEVREAIQKLGGYSWVVKAQIHAGGRGKGGGIKVCGTAQEVIAVAGDMIGMNLVTPQTGVEGQEVRCVYIEEACEINRELYLGLLLDRANSRLAFVGAAEGGMNIEEVAAATPEKILRVPIDPSTGMLAHHARNLAFGLGLQGSTATEAIKTIHGVYEAFTATESNLIEINPLVVTKDEKVLALDAKMDFDDNALFRHPDLVELCDENEEDPRERKAQSFGLSYIKLDGNIGCMVNGAGLAMATMDIIKLNGGKPANFLDVGGGATRDKVTEAFKIILSDPDVEGVLVNIFGGIMRCDVIAEGIVEAAREVNVRIPLVVRLKGTNVELGREILAKSGMSLSTADHFADAAKKIVAAVRRDH
ncbi:MAG: Succinyl-CoA ligase [ADP-forming] subunit beta [Alphaproteobacteria bacterium MarineAlpha9_Bin7]|nr:MAG: Succinyl-CoA ligase [ADP-forming] subunit beta [Alphaproteobacteria bacterium MarineAlpha9_Bin7]